MSTRVAGANWLAQPPGLEPAGQPRLPDGGRAVARLGQEAPVVIVRQRFRGRIAQERRIDGMQLRPNLPASSVDEGEGLWGYAVLVTDVD